MHGGTRAGYEAGSPADRGDDARSGACSLIDAGPAPERNRPATCSRYVAWIRAPAEHPNKRIDGAPNASRARRPVAQHFARVAAQYTSLRQTDHEPLHEIRDQLPMGPLIGIDVGAGTGRYTEPLIRLLSNRASVLAVDLSAAMLRVAVAAKTTRRTCRGVL